MFAKNVLQIDISQYPLSFCLDELGKRHTRFWSLRCPIQLKQLCIGEVSNIFKENRFGGNQLIFPDSCYTFVSTTD